MPEENFRDNLLRAIAAELHFLNRVTAAREMFAKSYFSLWYGRESHRRPDRHEHGRRHLPKFYVGSTRGSSSSRAGWFPSANREIMTP